MTVNKKLSQTLGALKKGYTVNNAYESFPTIQTMVNVAAASNDSVASAVTLASGAITTISGASLTDPGHYRTIRIKGNQAGVAGNVVVVGYDRGGRVVTDTIAASGASAVDGVIPMSAIASITFPEYVAAGDTISIGVSDKLGLYRPIESTADVVLAEKKASADTEFAVQTSTGTVNAMYGTIVPSGTLTALDSFKFSFETKQF
ncbi:MAG: hypothetical protein U9O94_06775 [Nanoarchaeota archaeon]|nr:hypothetical protein [Nanoarchaeota archaeon]